MTLLFTLLDCIIEGRKSRDEAKAFSLEILEGTTPEEEKLTIDVLVDLFGPFQFSEGMIPVSPMFWVCVYNGKIISLN